MVELISFYKYTFVFFQLYNHINSKIYKDNFF